MPTSLIHTDTFDALPLGSPMPKSYMWNNLIVEKRISVNWIGKLFIGGILDDFLTVLSSPVH